MLKLITLITLIMATVGCTSVTPYTEISSMQPMDAKYVVIASKDIDFPDLSISEMRRVFKGRLIVMASGNAIRPHILQSCKNSRECLHDILRATPSQLSQHDARVLFTGKGRPLDTVHSTVGLFWKLQDHPGSICILRKELWDDIEEDAEDNGFRILTTYTLGEIVEQ